MAKRIEAMTSAPDKRSTRPVFCATFIDSSGGGLNNSISQPASEMRGAKKLLIAPKTQSK
jgi:hypothetical protein